ncbi:PKD domain-containing protein [Planctomycetota bacterium]
MSYRGNRTGTIFQRHINRLGGIAAGDVVDFAGEAEWPRFTKNETPIAFDNDVAYAHYQLIFTAIRGPVGGSVNSMQIAEVELLGKIFVNVAPAVYAGLDQIADEGHIVSLGATFSDWNLADTHTAVIDWGDGSPAEQGVVDQDLDTVSGSHVYDDNGVYTATVTVTDDDGAEGADTLAVTVLNVAPTADAGTDQTINEGDLVELDPVTFNDKGTSDTHTAIIDWGDGTALDIGLVTESPFGPPGSTLGVDGTVDGSHVYADNGTYIVEVTITDDDGAVAMGTFTITVLNVVPTVTACIDQTIDEGQLLSLNVAVFNDLGTLDTHTATIDWGDGSPIEPCSVIESPYGPPGSTLGADGVISGSHVYADNGTFIATVTVTDDDGAWNSATFTVTVENVAPNVSVDIPVQNVQYSDPINEVTITATDVPADVMNAVISVLPDAGTIPGGLEFVGSPDRVGSGNWILRGIADLAPGTYVFVVTVFDEDSGSTNVDITINVQQEDAIITYNGPDFVSTPSIKDSEAIVELRAIIQDITAVHPASDPDPGNITYANVAFVIRIGNGDIIIEEDVAIELFDSDPTIGIASCTWEVDLGNSDSETFMLGIIVNGYYTRNSAVDNTLITVSKPVENSVTGGGHIINEYSAGVFAGDVGLKTNFGFNLKFNKKLTNLHGRVNIIIRQGNRVYQVKTNATQSLVINPDTNQAIFVSKANLIDITDPDNPISVAGNLTLLVNLTDSEDSETPDSIGFTLWNGNELWFSSNWAGTETIEQYLRAGNLVVRN